MHSYAQVMRHLREDMQATLARVRIEQEQALYLAQRAYLKQLLDAAGGNVSQAARIAGVSRTCIHEALVRTGLHFVNPIHQRRTIEGLHHLARDRAQTHT